MFFKSVYCARISGIINANPFPNYIDINSEPGPGGADKNVTSSSQCNRSS